MRIRIRIILGWLIRIRIRAKSLIRILIGVLEAQIGTVKVRGRSKWRSGGSMLSPEGSVDQWSQIRITLMSSRTRIRVCIRVKVGYPDPRKSKNIFAYLWIPSRSTLHWSMRIRNPDCSIVSFAKIKLSRILFLYTVCVTHLPNQIKISPNTWSSFLHVDVYLTNRYWYLGNELLGAATQLDIQKSVVGVLDGSVPETAQTCRRAQ